MCLELYNLMMGRSGVGGRRRGRDMWGPDRDILSDVLRSLNCSAVGSEATTGRFSWTSGELMFYVASATRHGL